MINLVTPCSRPENLAFLKESINFPCQWYIVSDADSPQTFFTEPWIHVASVKGGVAGHKQRNLALDLITEPDDWVYFLDDDTIIHPDFYDTLSKFMTLYPENSGWVFNQDCKDSIRWATQENVKVYHIDTAQFILKRYLIGDTRFKPVYEADGLFIEDIYNRNKNKFGHILKTLCYYNKLKW